MSGKEGLIARCKRWLFTPNPQEELRIRIFESDCGVNAGWFIERHGRRIAQLTDARWDDMFWDSYRIEPLSDDPAEREAVFTEEFWTNLQGLACRNREFDLYADFVLGSTRAADPGRVNMRSLCLRIGGPTTRERWLMWLRRRQSRLPS